MAFSGMNSTSFHTDQTNNQRKREMQNSSNVESSIILAVRSDQGQTHLGVRPAQTRAIL